MFKRLVPARESNIGSDDIDEAPIGGMCDGIGVSPVIQASLCGSCGMCMLEDVASSGLTPAESRDTISPSNLAATSCIPGAAGH